MKISRTVLSVLLVIIMGLAIGCSSNNNHKNVNGYSDPTPGWYEEIAEDSKYMYFYATGVAKSEMLSETHALTQARAAASDYMKIEVTHMIQDVMEEVGVDKDAQLRGMVSDAAETISRNTLRGGRKTRTQKIPTKDKRWRCYVKFQIPLSSLNENTVDYIQNEKALYNEFKASQKLKEMEVKASRLK